MHMKVGLQRPTSHGSAVFSSILMLSLPLNTFASNIPSNRPFPFKYQQWFRFYTGDGGASDPRARDVQLVFEGQTTKFVITMPKYQGRTTDDLQLEVTAEKDGTVTGEGLDPGLIPHTIHRKSASSSFLKLKLTPLRGKAISADMSVEGRFTGHLLESKTNEYSAVVGRIDFPDRALVLDLVDKYTDDIFSHTNSSLPFVLAYWESDIQMTERMIKLCDSLDNNCIRDGDKYLGGETLSYVPINSKRFNGNFNRPRACTIDAYIDYSVFKLFNFDLTLVATQITQYILDAGEIFRKLDFNEDGIQDNIRFRPGILDIFTYERGNTNLNVTSFDETWLRNFTSEPICATLQFIFDPKIKEFHFSMSPWLNIRGSSRTRGGACDPGPEETESREIRPPRYNAAVINIAKNYTTLPDKTVVLTLLHVMLHLFGAEHDDMMATSGKDCNPKDSSQNGFNLMHSIPVDGSKANHNKLSPCTRNAVNALLKNGIIDECFVEEAYLTCGNGYTEPWEDCDCQRSIQTTTCNPHLSPCCTVKTGSEWKFDSNCIQTMTGESKMLTCIYESEIRKSGCCNKDCEFRKSGESCALDKGLIESLGAEESVCHFLADQGYCNGISSTCMLKHKPDGMPCMSGARSCQGGKCNSTVCRDSGLKDCNCQEDGDARCQICCMGTAYAMAKCQTVVNLQVAADASKWPRPEGTVCSEDGGICNAAGACRTLVRSLNTGTHVVGERKNTEPTAKLDGSVPLKCSLQLLVGCGMLKIIMYAYIRN